MNNKKLTFAGIAGMALILVVFVIGYLTLQKKGTVQTGPKPTGFQHPTSPFIFPTNKIPRVPTATPIPTPTLAPQVTIGPSPDTRPIELITQVEQQSLKDNPDIYLSNKLPYSGEDFSMTYSIDPQGTIRFRVTSSTFSGSELQRKVALWLLSLNLTSSQISSLQIEY